ncbi:tetratricopeptide repeat protein [Schaalia canis]|uniref:Tetratricopeptide repeat protein n=1 Tax=Schaalia canis TaxID=100469 RepID=A0A3P1SH25_9ACTO|nr:tetratricopeptide repeat protein [Schaalia canis]RRC96250.1 tetratricopeptide repeat protein [Schaalia canis]
MERVIAEYWQHLQDDFAVAHPQKKFFNDYDETLPYLQKLEEFLTAEHAKHPTDVDVACYLASARLACRFDEEHCIKLLESFVSDNDAVLSDGDRARIFTNLGFYADDDQRRKHYLHEVADVGSPFVQTYKGLGLAYFSSCVDGGVSEDITQSIHAFERAMTICGDYEYAFGYAVALFQGKRFAEAVEVFEGLLAAHPDRPRLVLALAYCQIYLGNRELALDYLNRVHEGEAEPNQLNSDDVDAIEIINAHYVLEEYEHFVDACDEVLEEYSYSDWDHYFYALWVTGRTERFERTVQACRDEILQAIAEAQKDEDFEDEAERQEYINSCTADLQALEARVRRIQEEQSAPVLDLTLYPEYSCFLIDCVRHTL